MSITKTFPPLKMSLRDLIDSLPGNMYFLVITSLNCQLRSGFFGLLGLGGERVGEVGEGALETLYDQVTSKIDDETWKICSSSLKSDLRESS